jgi:tRNA(Ile2) C34 agmatinyltransferase TiaS
MKKKISEGAQIRQERLDAGLCGACGKRKRSKGKDGQLLKECRTCREYYNTWARKAAKKVVTK